MMTTFWTKNKFFFLRCNCSSYIHCYRCRVLNISMPNARNGCPERGICTPENIWMAKWKGKWQAKIFLDYQNKFWCHSNFCFLFHTLWWQQINTISCIVTAITTDVSCPVQVLLSFIVGWSKTHWTTRYYTLKILKTRELFLTILASSWPPWNC